MTHLSPKKPDFQTYFGQRPKFAKAQPLPDVRNRSWKQKTNRMAEKKYQALGLPSFLGTSNTAEKFKMKSALSGELARVASTESERLKTTLSGSALERKSISQPVDNEEEDMPADYPEESFPHDLIEFLTTNCVPDMNTERSRRDSTVIANNQSQTVKADGDKANTTSISEDNKGNKSLQDTPVMAANEATTSDKINKPKFQRGVPRCYYVKDLMKDRKTSTDSSSRKTEAKCNGKKTSKPNKKFRSRTVSCSVSNASKEGELTRRFVSLDRSCDKTATVGADMKDTVQDVHLTEELNKKTSKPKLLEAKVNRNKMLTQKPVFGSRSQSGVATPNNVSRSHSQNRVEKQNYSRQKSILAPKSASINRGHNGITAQIAIPTGPSENETVVQKSGSKSCSPREKERTNLSFDIFSQQKTFTTHTSAVKSSYPNGDILKNSARESNNQVDRVSPKPLVKRISKGKPKIGDKKSWKKSKKWDKNRQAFKLLQRRNDSSCESSRIQKDSTDSESEDITEIKPCEYMVADCQVCELVDKMALLAIRNSGEENIKVTSQVNKIDDIDNNNEENKETIKSAPRKKKTSSIPVPNKYKKNTSTGYSFLEKLNNAESKAQSSIFLESNKSKLEIPNNKIVYENINDNKNTTFSELQTVQTGLNTRMWEIPSKIARSTNSRCSNNSINLDLYERCENAKLVFNKSFEKSQNNYLQLPGLETVYQSCSDLEYISQSDVEPNMDETLEQTAKTIVENVVRNAGKQMSEQSLRSHYRANSSNKTKQSPGTNAKQSPRNNTKQSPRSNTKQSPRNNTKQSPRNNTKQSPRYETKQSPRNKKTFLTSENKLGSKAYDNCDNVSDSAVSRTSSRRSISPRKNIDQSYNKSVSRKFGNEIKTNSRPCSPTKNDSSPNNADSYSKFIGEPSACNLNATKITTSEPTSTNQTCSASVTNSLKKIYNGSKKIERNNTSGKSSLHSHSASQVGITTSSTKTSPDSVLPCANSTGDETKRDFVNKLNVQGSHARIKSGEFVKNDSTQAPCAYEPGSCPIPADITTRDVVKCAVLSPRSISITVNEAKRIKEDSSNSSRKMFGGGSTSSCPTFHLGATIHMPCKLSDRVRKPTQIPIGKKMGTSSVVLKAMKATSVQCGSGKKKTC